MLPLPDGGVQHLKELAQPQSRVAAVGVGSLGDECGKDISGIEDAGIVGKQAEHQADEKALQIVPLIAGFLQGIVQLAHYLRGFDVDRILIAESPLPDAKNESEILHVLGKLPQSKTNAGAFFQIVQLERLEIAYQDISGKLMLLKAGKVVQGLFLGAREIPAGTLLLDEEHAFPEQVDEASLVTKFLDGFLEAGDAAARDAENLEKLVVEGLAFPTFVVGMVPFLGKAGGASSDLVPTEAHLFSRQSETLMRTSFGCQCNCVTAPKTS